MRRRLLVRKSVGAASQVGGTPSHPPCGNTRPCGVAHGRRRPSPDAAARARGAARCGAISTGHSMPGMGACAGKDGFFVIFAFFAVGYAWVRPQRSQGTQRARLTSAACACCHRCHCRRARGGGQPPRWHTKPAQPGWDTGRSPVSRPPPEARSGAFVSERGRSRPCGVAHGRRRPSPDAAAHARGAARCGAISTGHSMPGMGQGRPAVHSRHAWARVQAMTASL